jgi:hypothetical protein
VSATHATGAASALIVVVDTSPEHVERWGIGAAGERRAGRACESSKADG